jgi:hypothetical protein
VITGPGRLFEASDVLEINSLVEKGATRFEQADEASDEVRLFKSRLVREIKYRDDATPYEKSRLVVQGYADEEKKEILTQSPTVQQASQRLLVALALNRMIFCQLPRALQSVCPPGTVIQVVQLLYGLAELGLFWWATYHRHHKD